jgi:hypothetical protein
MSTERWVERAIGLQGVEQELVDKSLVIMLEGKNAFGDRIFTYLELSLGMLAELKKTMDSGADFSPSSFGKVVAGGTRNPSPELLEDMSRRYNMVDLPPPGRSATGSA